MKTLSEQMAFYSAYHRDARNKATHFVGVPMLIFSFLIPMGWLRFHIVEWDITLATIFAVSVLLYYYALDMVLALAMTVLVGFIYYFADKVSQMEMMTSLIVFISTFVAGWVIQLIGHAIEGRRPALVDNLFQIFVAPIFLMAEVFFAIGLKKNVEAEVEKLVVNHLPASK
ncbi:DUF962 domain-containing protein [bacterium]|nr:DUF962 domain-containing protein [bacterium]